MSHPSYPPSAMLNYEGSQADNFCFLPNQVWGPQFTVQHPYADTVAPAIQNSVYGVLSGPTESLQQPTAPPFITNPTILQAQILTPQFQYHPAILPPLASDLSNPRNLLEIEERPSDPKIASITQTDEGQLHQSQEHQAHRPTALGSTPTLPDLNVHIPDFVPDTPISPPQTAQAQRPEVRPKKQRVGVRTGAARESKRRAHDNGMTTVKYKRELTGVPSSCYHVQSLNGKGKMRKNTKNACLLCRILKKGVFTVHSLMYSSS